MTANPGATAQSLITHQSSSISHQYSIPAKLRGESISWIVRDRRQKSRLTRGAKEQESELTFGRCHLCGNSSLTHMTREHVILDEAAKVGHQWLQHKGKAANIGQMASVARLPPGRYDSLPPSPSLFLYPGCCWPFWPFPLAVLCLSAGYFSWLLPSTSIPALLHSLNHSRCCCMNVEHVRALTGRVQYWLLVCPAVAHSAQLQ